MGFWGEAFCSQLDSTDHFFADKGSQAEGAQYSDYGNEKHGHEDKYNKYDDAYSELLIL